MPHEQSRDGDVEGFPLGDEEDLSYEERQGDRRDPVKAGRRSSDGIVIGRRNGVIIAFSYTAVWIALAIGAWMYQHNNAQKDRTDRRQFKQLDALVTSIQDERRANIRNACLTQNEKHDNTIDALNAIIAPALKRATPAQRTQIERSQTATILLIDALAPKQNCRRVVAQSTAKSQSKEP